MDSPPGEQQRLRTPYIFVDCTENIKDSSALEFFFLGDQAAGTWNRKHKSCRGAGGMHDSSDGAGLPGHLAAIRCACTCCHDGLQSICWPCHRYHSCVLCKKQHCLQPHHIHFHEQTGKLVWSKYKQRKRGIQAHAACSWQPWSCVSSFEATLLLRFCVDGTPGPLSRKHLRTRPRFRLSSRPPRKLCLKSLWSRNV